MKKRKILKTLILLVIAGFLIGGATMIYMFKMPHQDVQSSKTDYSLTSTQIVEEYLADTQSANEKYLADDGNSKILEITGVVSKISEDFSGQIVVLLKAEGSKAGVSASFTEETNANAAQLTVGETVTIKGVIRSGAAYDEDLELYENVILEKIDLLTK